MGLFLRPRFLAAALFVLALAFPAGAHATPGWLPAQTAAASPAPGGSADLAMSDGGGIVAAWLGEDEAVVTHVKPPGEAADEDLLEIDDPSAPQVAVNPRGDAIVVFDADPGGSGRSVFAAYRAFDAAAWGAPQLVAAGSQADVAIDADGNALITWVGAASGAGQVHALRRAANGTLGTVDPLLLPDLDPVNPPPADAAVGTHPAIALDADGDAIIAFAGDAIYRAERAAAASSFNPAEPVGTVGDATQPVQVRASGDHAVIAWVTGTAPSATLATTYRDPLLGWGAPADVVTDAGGIPDWDVALSASGQRLAIWAGSAGSGAKTFDTGLGAWASDAGFAADAAAVSLDMTAAGAAVAAALDPAGALHALSRPAAGPWSAATEIATGAAAPAIGVDDEGNAAATWRESGEQRTRLYDAVAPVLSTPTLSETTIELGDELTASVTATDRIGPVTISWDYGDASADSDGAHTYTEVGDYTVTATATDGAGSTATASDDVAVEDTTEPDTTITGSTDGNLAADATVSFTGTDISTTPLTFICTVGATTIDPCTSPQTLAGLGDGDHTVEVAARDDEGNVDSTPDSVSITVDETAPETAIDDATDGNIAADAVVEFSAPDATSYVCLIDGTPVTPCSSPQTLTGLSDGDHTFSVAGQDAAGNVDATPATTTISVDTAAPTTTISASTNGSIAAADPTVTFSGTDVTSYVCDVDGTPVTPCASVQTLTGLSEGTHTFSVAAKDDADNVDATPASVTVLVDRTEPTTTISDATVGNLGADPTVTFGGSDANAVTFDCTIDGNPVTPCSSPQSLAGLSEGTHTFSVAATDAVGNADQSPDTRTITVDRTAPTVTIGETPAGATNAAAVSVPFSSTATDVARFECAVDTGAFAACTSPQSLTIPQDGNHQFKVKAIDGAGNESALATRSIVIDRTGPEAGFIAPPRAFTNVSPVSFTIGSSESGTYQYRLDGGPWTDSGQAEVTLENLAERQYVLDIRALDGLGNVGLFDSRTFVVDYTAPRPLTASASGSTLSGSAGTANGDRRTVSVSVFPASSAGNALLKRDVSVSNGGWSTAVDLAEGKYFALVTQTDEALNASFATVDFTVGPAPPAPPPAPKQEAPRTTTPPSTPPTTTTTTQEVVRDVRRALVVSVELVTETLERTGLDALRTGPASVVPISAPGAGVMAVRYETPAAAAARADGRKKAILVASGRRTVTKAGVANVRVRVTKAGRRLLRRAKRLSITVRTTFTPKGAKTSQSSARKVTLRRGRR